MRRAPAATTVMHRRRRRRMVPMADVRRRHWRADPVSADFSSASRSCSPNGHLPSSGLPSLDDAGVAVESVAVADVCWAPGTAAVVDGVSASVAAPSTQWSHLSPRHLRAVSRAGTGNSLCPRDPPSPIRTKTCAEPSIPCLLLASNSR